MQAAATRAHGTVDRAQLVPRQIRADVGVFDTGADVAGEVCAEAFRGIYRFGRRERDFAARDGNTETREH